MSYRVIAQSIRTGEFLDWDFPVSGVQIKETLSGPSIITGRLEPEMPDLVKGTDAWSTWLHVEQDGQIRASGIIQPSSLNEETLAVECEGVAGYPHGIPFLGDYKGIQVDPLNVTRMIWQHVQSYPDGNLGVTLDATTSPVRIGTEEEEVDFETGAGERVQFTAGPYKLNWWSNQDCGTEINSLAAETPFDYAERVSWSADKTAVNHHIRLGYPRLGARRENLRFAQGENIVSYIPLVEMDDAYASSVIVLGAGEGRKMVRATAGTSSPHRVRRVVTVVDKSITSTARAQTRAREELRRRQALLSMRQITVDARHENAKLGTYSVGDDILIIGEFPYLGEMRTWHRITSYTWSPDADAVTLELAPSNSFSYGRS